MSTEKTTDNSKLKGRVYVDLHSGELLAVMGFNWTTESVLCARGFHTIEHITIPARKFFTDQYVRYYR